MTKKYPSQNLKQVLLRIPEEMRQALEDAANLSGRTLTAEVLLRIERTLDEDVKTGGIVGDLQGQIDDLRSRIDRLEGVPLAEVEGEEKQSPLLTGSLALLKHGRD